MNALSKFMSFSGFNPFDKSWKMNRFGVMKICSIVLCYIMTINAATNAWPNYIEVFQSCMGIGILTQSALKVLHIFHSSVTFQKLKDQVDDMYDHYKKADALRQKILMKSLRTSRLIFNILSIVDASAVLIFIAFPFCSYFIFNKIKLMFPFYWPFFNHKTVFGFFFNSISHAVIILFTLVLHTPFDCTFGLFVTQYVAMVELFKLEMRDFESHLLNANSGIDEMDAMKKFRELIIRQKSLFEYIGNLGSYYRRPCFITSFTSIFSMCFGLILMVVMQEIVSYGLVWALFGQLFVYYLFGTTIYVKV